MEYIRINLTDSRRQSIGAGSELLVIQDADSTFSYNFDMIVRGELYFESLEYQENTAEINFSRLLNSAAVFDIYTLQWLSCPELIAGLRLLPFFDTITITDEAGNQYVPEEMPKFVAEQTGGGEKIFCVLQWRQNKAFLNQTDASEITVIT